jgi:hypothetical protein
MKPTTSRLVDIMASPSNAVFLAIALTLCAGFFLKIVSQENFIYIAGQVFAYYFGKAQAKAQIADALMATPPPIDAGTSPELPKEG